MIKKKRTVWQLLLDIIEFYIPAIMFLILFITFILGVFFRYIVKSPQSWTFELSSITFLFTVILAGCIADRYEEHIAFDMFYNKMSEKTKCIMRIISNLLIILFLVIILPSSVKYLISFKKLATPILKIPQYMVFISFPILLIDLIIRRCWHLILDIKSLINKVYIPSYQNNLEVEK